MGFLIGGQPRSGTTLMLKLCNTHPDIRLTYEFNNYMMVGESQIAYIRWILKRGWQEHYRYFAGEYWNETKFTQQMFFVFSYCMRVYKWSAKQVTPKQIDDALSQIFVETKIIGDKFPGYVFHLEKLSQYPTTHMVIMYRDVRDVVSSTLKMARTNWEDTNFVDYMNTAEKVAHRWNRAIAMQEKHQDNPRVLPIRYEDLIQQPEQTLYQVGEWLGIDPNAFDTEKVKNTSIGKYREYLTPEEIATVEDITRPTMQRLDYTISSD